MIEYTKEEYEMLYEMTKEFGIIAYFLESHVTDNPLRIGSAAVFKDIQEAIKVCSTKCYEMVYELPFL